MRLVDADELRLGKFPEPTMGYQLGWNDALDAAATQAHTHRATWNKIHDVTHTDAWFCSNCHHVRTGYPSRYCPHCGAWMEDKV